MAKNRVKIIYEDCDTSKADDTSLPYTAYLIEYMLSGFRKYDIAVCTKTVDLFDYYYDKYKKDFVKFTQSNGKCNQNSGQHLNSSSPFVRDTLRRFATKVVGELTPPF